MTTVFSFEGDESNNLVSADGIVMFSRFVQPENAPEPMLVALLGIIMLVRLEQP